MGGDKVEAHEGPGDLPRHWEAILGLLRPVHVELEPVPAFLGGDAVPEGDRPAPRGDGHVLQEEVHCLAIEGWVDVPGLGTEEPRGLPVRLPGLQVVSQLPEGILPIHHPPPHQAPVGDLPHVVRQGEGLVLVVVEMDRQGGIVRAAPRHRGLVRRLNAPRGDEVDVGGGAPHGDEAPGAGGSGPNQGSVIATASARGLIVGYLRLGAQPGVHPLAVVRRLLPRQLPAAPVQRRPAGRPTHRRVLVVLRGHRPVQLHAGLDGLGLGSHHAVVLAGRRAGAPLRTVPRGIAPPEGAQLIGAAHGVVLVPIGQHAGRPGRGAVALVRGPLLGHAAGGEEPGPLFLPLLPDPDLCVHSPSLRAVHLHDHRLDLPGILAPSVDPHPV
mmetsp:Transcript_63966/g.147319  ORF Transcript_63966/g.147319 Transcript_63966/m.147319 type:complete len:383 (-) Transcript_63966:969-2117(-)